MLGSATSRSRPKRNAASVLPEPVGAEISVCSPVAMAGHACAWACGRRREGPPEPLAHLRGEGAQRHAPQGTAGTGAAFNVARRPIAISAPRRGGDHGGDEAGLPADVLGEVAADRGAGREAGDQERRRPRVGLGHRAGRGDRADDLVGRRAERRDQQPGRDDQQRHQRDAAARAARGGSPAAAAGRCARRGSAAAASSGGRRRRGRRPRSRPPRRRAAAPAHSGAPKLLRERGHGDLDRAEAEADGRGGERDGDDARRAQRAEQAVRPRGRRRASSRGSACG